MTIYCCWNKLLGGPVPSSHSLPQEVSSFLVFGFFLSILTVQVSVKSSIKNNFLYLGTLTCFGLALFPIGWLCPILTLWERQMKLKKWQGPGVEDFVQGVQFTCNISSSIAHSLGGVFRSMHKNTSCLMADMGAAMWNGAAVLEPPWPANQRGFWKYRFLGPIPDLLNHENF